MFEEQWKGKVELSKIKPLTGDIRASLMLGEHSWAVKCWAANWKSSARVLRGVYAADHEPSGAGVS
jgi:hypothetical protein